MHYIFSYPDWVKRHKHNYSLYDEIPLELFDSINVKLNTVQSATPVVSILIAAWNEETNILNCISSLSETKTEYPFEIIVINNNSTDKTQNTLDKLHVKSLFQPVQGCGPARQLGQETALGEYILLADADCIYSEGWVEEMMNHLTKKDVVCVYGRYSFIPEEKYPRWQLYLFEKLKDIIAELRHFKRPYLNAYGISMGYVKKYGLKVGYVTYKIWGDDGRLCFDLMPYGKVLQVKTGTTRVWTGPRTLQRDGGLGKALKNRLKLESKRFFSMFKAHAPHDTKTSKNE